MTPRMPSLDPAIDRWKIIVLMLLFGGILLGAMTWTSAPWGGLLP